MKIQITKFFENTLEEAVWASDEECPALQQYLRRSVDGNCVPKKILPPTCGVGARQDNYESAEALVEAVEAQLEESVGEEHAIKMTEDKAKTRFGEKMVILYVGALVIDGTSGVPVNVLVRVRGETKIDHLRRLTSAQGNAPRAPPKLWRMSKVLIDWFRCLWMIGICWDAEVV